MWNKSTKPTYPATVFFFPRRAGQAVVVYWIKKADNHKGSDLVCYRLCVCASGSLITDIFSCRAEINVSCLHLGQYNGKFSRTVSSRIFNRVLQPQTGHKTHCSSFILPPLNKTLRGSRVREHYCKFVLQSGYMELQSET